MYNNQNIELINPFDFAVNPLEFILKSFSSIHLLKDEKKQSNRLAVKNALKKLEEISEQSNPQFFSKLEKLSMVPLDQVHQEEIKGEFLSLFETKEFVEFKKILITIPENQQKQFLQRVLLEIKTKLAAIRTYNNYSILLMTQREKINKINLFEQGIDELFLLVHQLDGELKAKKASNTRLDSLGLSFFLMTLRLLFFVQGKLSDDEILDSIAYFSHGIKVKEKAELKQYWTALTN